MVKVYIEKKNAPEFPYSLVFWPNFKFEISPKRLFLQEIMAQYQEPFFTVVERSEEADFFAVPYEYFFAEDACPEYLARVFALAKAAGKKVLLFDYTDYVDRTAKIPSHAVLFRVSAYRHHKQSNEIIMPYFVEDMGARYGIGPKEKGTSCVVGYCGQSRFGTETKRFRAQVKQFAHSLALRLSGDAEPSAHVRGIFWRGRALDMLVRGGIKTSFIERAFYSLHRFGISLQPAVVRHEYVENLRESDLAFCARGDANNSQRFYEALSASRVPLFLDTDCMLPLEEVIDYDRVMLRVPARELVTLPARIRSLWEKETPESFLARERRAREVYEKYLRSDRFFALVSDRKRSPYMKLLYE